MKKEIKNVYLLKGQGLSKDGSLYTIPPIITISHDVIHYFIKHAHSVKITTLPFINKAPKSKEDKR